MYFQTSPGPDSTERPADASDFFLFVYKRYLYSMYIIYIYVLFRWDILETVALLLAITKMAEQSCTTPVSQ